MEHLCLAYCQLKTDFSPQFKSQAKKKGVLQFEFHPFSPFSLLYMEMSCFTFSWQKKTTKIKNRKEHFYFQPNQSNIVRAIVSNCIAIHTLYYDGQLIVNSNWISVLFEIASVSWSIKFQNAWDGNQKEKRKTTATYFSIDFVYLFITTLFILNGVPCVSVR